jgi:hypothetical protein
MAADALIMERSLGSNFIEFPILGIARITVVQMA